MSENPLLSVIIANYNKKNYISQCIESVVKQTYYPLEIVIVDDCSTDGSQKIIERFSNLYKQIKFIGLQENCGVSHARNLGASKAHGQYITFLDSDDYYYNIDKLKFEMEAALKNEHSFAYSKIVYVDEKGKTLSSITNTDETPMEGMCAKRMLRNCNFGLLPRDYCMRKEIFTNAGMYDEKSNFYEDLDLLIRIASKNAAVYTGKLGTAYRQVKNGLSARKRSEQMRGRWNVSWNCYKNVKSIHTLDNFFYLVGWKLIIESKIMIKKILNVYD